MSAVKAAWFVGAWHLVSYERRLEDGTVDYPLGQDLKGLLIYLENGNMSVQLMLANRTKFQSNDMWTGTAEEYRDAFTTYTAYFGRYTVHEDESFVEHHVDGSLFPNWSGGVQKRFVSFGEGTLTLSSEAGILGSQKCTVSLCWRSSP